MKESGNSFSENLSVSIIASNEERNIARCLASVEKIADEIVLVHNDTNDATVTIAKGYGVKCFEFDWHGHRDQKNISLSKTLNKWVLCLDADEELSKEMTDSIVEVLKSKNLNDFDGYYFNRCSYFLGRWIKHGDWYPDRKLRLVKKSEAEWRGTSEHDKLSVNGKVKYLDGDLLHYSYPSMEAFVSKIVYFSNFHYQRQIKKQVNFKLIYVLVRPLWRFLRAYFLKFGFLDGFPGLFIAVSTAFATFFKHSRIFEKGLKDE